MVTDWPGQSGHIHVSLQDKKGKPVFYDVKKSNNMSDEMRYLVGGQQKLMPELLAMIAPTVNSFTRLIPGFWASTIELVRCVAFREVPSPSGSNTASRRLAPTLIWPWQPPSVLDCGEWRTKSSLKSPLSAMSTKKPSRRNYIYRQLYEAAGRLKTSKPARELFGGTFVDHYAASRE